MRNSRSTTQRQKPSGESAIRFELSELIRKTTMLRGTLTTRLNTCGKSGCRCAEGDRHPALYVVSNTNGSFHQKYVSQKREREIKEAIENFQRAQKLLDELSSLTWKRLKER